MKLDWKKVSQEEQKVGYKVMVSKQFVLPDGKQYEYTTYGRFGGQNIATIAVTADKRVIVARQFRAGPERILDELPGGGQDADEEPAAAAARELLEETGYQSEEPLEYLGIACRDAYTNETNNYFLAYNCRKVANQKLDPTEFVEIDLISIDKLLNNAKTGRMSDSVGVLMAYDKLKEIQNGKQGS